MEVLSGLTRADAAIVGGGLTGLLVGAALAQEGLKIAIVDAGGGSFSRPWEAASIHAAPLYARIKSAHGTKVAQLYGQCLQAQLHSLLAAPLPYVQRMPLYTYARDNAALPALEAQHELYMQLHVPAHVAPDAGGCPFPVALSLLAPDQAVMNMARWRDALAASICRMGGRIYHHSRVTSFDGLRVCTPRGCVHAPLTILTTGIPLGWQDAPLLASHTLAHCTLTGGAPLHSIQQSVQDDGLSLCPSPPGAVAALDAGRCGTQQQQVRLTRAGEILHRHVPDAQQGEMHYTRRIQTADGLPFIGVLPGTRHLCAAGVDGILSAMHAAEVLTRHILGRALPEDALYAPTRKLPAALLRRINRQSAFIRMANLPRLTAPACAHCNCRMRYTAPLSLWECPLCSSACTILGRPAAGPGMSPVRVSPRQRPD